MAMLALARGDPSHKATLVGTAGFSLGTAGNVSPFLNAEGFLEDPLRILSHPSFEQEVGLGIYEYAFNPHITRNFARGPIKKVDFAIERTLSSSVLVQQPQLESDVVITEVWLGDGQLSTLSDMYLTFMEFWNTLPAIGETLTWQPLDLSEESFSVQIVNVQLGSAADHEFAEVRETLATVEGAYLKSTLLLQLKIVPDIMPPKGVISLAGA